MDLGQRIGLGFRNVEEEENTENFDRDMIDTDGGSGGGATGYSDRYRGANPQPLFRRFRFGVFPFIDDMIVDAGPTRDGGGFREWVSVDRGGDFREWVPIDRGEQADDRRWDRYREVPDTRDREVPDDRDREVPELAVPPDFDMFPNFTAPEATVRSTPPAARLAIQNLPSIVVRVDGENNDDRPNCAVCMEEMSSQEQATLLPCSHYFHQDCILPWLDTHNTCPVCRYELPIGL